MVSLDLEDCNFLSLASLSRNEMAALCLEEFWVKSGEMAKCCYLYLGAIGTRLRALKLRFRF